MLSLAPSRGHGIGDELADGDGSRYVIRDRRGRRHRRFLPERSAPRQRSGALSLEWRAIPKLARGEKPPNRDQDWSEQDGVSKPPSNSRSVRNADGKGLIADYGARRPAAETSGLRPDEYDNPPARAKENLAKNLAEIIQTTGGQPPYLTAMFCRLISKLCDVPSPPRGFNVQSAQLDRRIRSGRTAAGDRTPACGRRKTAAEFIGVSHVTLERMRKLGTAPKHLALSPRRLGYRIADLLAWLDERANGARPREPCPTTCKRRPGRDGAAAQSAGWR